LWQCKIGHTWLMPSVIGSSFSLQDDRTYAEASRAFANAEWTAACVKYLAVVERYPGSAEAWEGLAAAAYWVPDEEKILGARERAYHLYCERGDNLTAARMAGWLAVDWFELRGQDAIANGWLQRAQRLIDKRQETPESAWLAVAQARLGFLLGREAAAVSRAAARAAASSRRLNLPHMEALSLSLDGLARLGNGDVRGAVQRLDEAAAIVLANEPTDLTFAAFTLCQLMAACERLRDFNRARQWCTVARQFSEDRGFPVVLSICRPHYGAVLMWRGHWPEAEEHLRIGSRELLEFMPPFATGALSLLGALRWRQGRWDEAEEIFNQVKHEPSAQTAIAELLAGRDEMQAAIETLERHLRTVPTADKLERGPPLEVLVRCLASEGSQERAAEHLTELREIADSVRTLSLRGAASFAEGSLASAMGNLDAARGCLGEAVDLFERAGAPFESGRARVALAESLRLLGQLDAAARETHIAQETLSRIGAAKEADTARRLHEAIEAQRAAVGRSSNVLTPREEEILQLLAQGRSNQEIAASLVLSVRTVERHISNIYEKLGLEGRTARTAAAARAYETAAKSARLR
jgi:LuxR family maltose regulon positive regulatory protein